MLIVLALAGALLATDGNPPSAPQRLAETGFHEAKKLPFVPQYPLWSDGAAKSRWISIPEGSRIDVSDSDAWQFPVGTKFWKEFTWDGRKVETRMIWKTSDQTWVFAAYQWNEGQTEAVLAPESGIRNVVEVAPGKRHSIPAIEDCNACHRSSPAVVLGFNALQLSDDRDPMAPHAEPLPPGAVTLKSLLKDGKLQPKRTEYLTKPPRIRESDPIARAALGYLSANCGSCHNDRGSLARLGLHLSHKTGTGAESAVITTVNVASSEYHLPGLPEQESRIVVPGAPDRSTLLYRMRSRRPSSQMPPLGTVMPDAEAVELVRRWIMGIKSGE
jgi:hypothetical protein